MQTRIKKLDISSLKPHRRAIFAYQKKSLPKICLLSYNKAMVAELTVKIKDDEKSLSKKYLIYELMTINDINTHPLIQDCIDETLSNFNGQPESIKLTINIEVS